MVYYYVIKYIPNSLGGEIMYGLDVLVQKVLLLTVMIALGAILRLTKKADGNLAKGFSDVVVYLTQPAMIIYSFLDAPFSKRIIITSLCVLGFSMVLHLGYFYVSKLLYKKAPEKQQLILRYSTIFTNAGFMGIPLISELISPEAAIYATFYVVSFNVYNWSLGCYMYSKDRSYISAKKMLLNPATIPTYIGLALFIIGGLWTVPKGLQPIFDSFIVPVIKDDVLFLLKSTVIPMSMMMIGIRLAESDFKTMFKDKYLPILTVVRLILIPFAVMGIMKLVELTGLIPDSILTPAATVLVISSSTPVAAMANIFAERFDGDAVYASKIVSVTTLLSLATMPMIAAVLSKVF